MPGRAHMPPFTGATEWLNTEPLGPADLRGHLVLVNFWTLTCINWLRQAPHIRAWARAYRSDGLIVVGVHTPEFSFEHILDHVRNAIADRNIDYPVVIDNDYAIWSAFANHYWPALYIVDSDGVIHDQYFGEGRYEQSERVLQQLLGIDRTPAVVQAHGVEANADWANLRTPETYIGYARSERSASLGAAAFDARHTYAPSEQLNLNQWALTGGWTMGSESAVLEQAGGSISCRFHARDAHLVLTPGARSSIPFRVTLDGTAPGRAHGIDVDEGGVGVVSDGRLYQLVRQQGPIGERLLEISFLEAGAEAYVLTFG